MRWRGMLLSLIQRPMYSSLFPWVSARWGTGYLVSRSNQKWHPIKFRNPIRNMNKENSTNISAESKKLIPEWKAWVRRPKDWGSEFCSPNVMVPEKPTKKKKKKRGYSWSSKLKPFSVSQRVKQGRDEREKPKQSLETVKSGAKLKTGTPILQHQIGNPRKRTGGKQGTVLLMQLCC